MKLALTCLICLSLVGCATAPKQTVPQVVVETKIVKVKIPAEYLEMPAQVPHLDTSKATEKDVAKWLVDLDHRMDLLEGKLKAVKEFNDRE